MVWQTKNKWYNIKPIKEAVSSLLLEREVLLWLNNLYTNYQIIEEDTFEDLQDTYEFSKNHDRRNEREK